MKTAISFLLILFLTGCKKPFDAFAFKIYNIDVQKYPLETFVYTSAVVECQINSDDEVQQMLNAVESEIRKNDEVTSLAAKDVWFYTWLYDSESKIRAQKRWIAWVKQKNNEPPRIFTDDVSFESKRKL